MPPLSFIIPVRNDAARLRTCLASIAAAAQGHGPIEMVVVDNGSTDESAQVAREAGALVLERPGQRLGQLRNDGSANASGSVLAFVDADHAIGPDWITAALEDLGDPGVAATGADCHPPPDANWVQKAYDRLRRHEPGLSSVDWLGSGNMAVRRDAFESVRGFDTSLETCEDVDLCRRLRLSGWRLTADSRMHNVHFGDPRRLRQVVLGEIWRGRDNIRVSLRPPRTLRTLASAALPVTHLIGLIATAAGVFLSIPLLMFAGLIPVGLVTLRALRMRCDSWRSAFENLAVAAAYEAGRTGALITRASHGIRRRAG